MPNRFFRRISENFSDNIFFVGRNRLVETITIFFSCKYIKLQRIMYHIKNKWCLILIGFYTNIKSVICLILVVIGWWLFLSSIHYCLHKLKQYRFHVRFFFIKGLFFQPWTIFSGVFFSILSFNPCFKGDLRGCIIGAFENIKLTHR